MDSTKGIEIHSKTLAKVIFNRSKYFTFFAIRTFTFPTFMAVVASFTTTFSTNYVRLIGHDVPQTYTAFHLVFYWQNHLVVLN